eukprot:TRINITY_DN16534_c0_g1_i4.p1 TRINITY_DN16534_c0_g1~~TRINITY_DN16534_c0_g1_i4.p1  ORF type:complete len:524 (-),score=90.00 TRINITY_DN16534_c0_g1_i4:281-1852(-)
MIRRPPRSTLSSSSAASDVYKRQVQKYWLARSLLHMCWYGNSPGIGKTTASGASEAGDEATLDSAPAAQGGYQFSRHAEFKRYLKHDSSSENPTRFACRHRISAWFDRVLADVLAAEDDDRHHLLDFVELFEQGSRELPKHRYVGEGKFTPSEFNGFQSLELFDTDILTDAVFGMNTSSLQFSGTYRGQETWVHAHVSELMSPYHDLFCLLHHLDPDPASLVVDVGSGTGRLGVVVPLSFPELRYHGYEIVASRHLLGHSVVKNLDLPNVSHFIAQDVVHWAFDFPDASRYFFLYDPVSVDLVPVLLSKIHRTSRNQLVTVIAMKDNFAHNVDKQGHSLLWYLEQQPWLTRVDVVPSLARQQPYLVFDSKTHLDKDSRLETDSDMIELSDWAERYEAKLAEEKRHDDIMSANEQVAKAHGEAENRDKIPVEFMNKLAKPVELFWENPKGGVLQAFGVVEPKVVRKFISYHGHVFVVKAEDSEGKFRQVLEVLRSRQIHPGEPLKLEIQRELVTPQAKPQVQEL